MAQERESGRAMKTGGWIAVVMMMISGVASADDRPTLVDAVGEAAATLPRGGMVLGVQNVGGPPRFDMFGTLTASQPDTPAQRLLFEIGSVSKLFTGLLLAQSVLEGKVGLSTTVGSVLDEELAGADPALRAITLEQLATHRSCLPRLPDNLAPADMADPYAEYGHEHLYSALRALQLDGSAPCEVAYSNLGYALLGHLLERVHGASWATLVQRGITDPAGMVDTVQVLDASQAQRFVAAHAGDADAREWTFGVFAGAGALRSTAADMLAFGNALLDPAHALAPAWALAGQLRAELPAWGGGIGLGVLSGSQRGEDFLWHNGGTGGFRSEFRVYPQAQRVEVLLVNNSVLDTEAVYARLDPPATPPVARPSVPTQVGRQASLAGLYRVDRQSTFTVLLRDGELWVRLTGQPFLPVRHIGNDRFSYEAVAAELQFERDDSGAATGLVLFQNSREMRAQRLDEAPPELHFPEREALDAYVGTYTLAPGAVFTLSVNADTLFAQLSGQPALPVFAVAEDRFDYDVVPASLQFERGDDGRVEAVVLHQGGIEQRAMKDDRPGGR